MKISRQVESEIPIFSSHKLARKYFKNKYGEKFIQMSFEEIDGETVYFYGLLLNPAVFFEGQKQLAEGEGFSGMEYLHSYQSVEIWENGSIHILH